MHDVVAVHGVVSVEVSKLEEELEAAGINCPYSIVSYPRYILPGYLIAIAGERLAISREDLEFFKVDMDRVLPAVTSGERP